jgi:hypothetical protein
MGPLAAVELSQLLDVIWVSLLAGVVVTTLFSLVVLASGRSADARRSGRATAATGYVVLAVLCFALFAALVVFGVNVMLAKD